MGEMMHARIGDGILVMRAGQVIGRGRIVGAVALESCAMVVYEDEFAVHRIGVPPAVPTLEVFIVPDFGGDTIPLTGLDVEMPVYAPTLHAPAYDPATEHYHHRGCEHDPLEQPPRETQPILDCGHEGPRNRPCQPCRREREEEQRARREHQLLDREKRIMRDFSRSDEQFRSPWYMGPAGDVDGGADEYWDWRRKRGAYILSGSVEDLEAMLEYVTPECPPLASDMARLGRMPRGAWVAMGLAALAMALVCVLVPLLWHT